ncbi:amidohydrolase family protein [Spongiactinospora sp. TRM90649]|uniref:amidohydrolase family protein n=1 Tax=Spongiactinospora sp. TRM90649 TaxID=3031114 RepID=UPI0023F9F414|nr:amidohydrolase family protein [Spongiactinospora sp. TRM90649]MDF5753708.1 amidohydrolase family protein [Spongiactinospora sp. TRM90649]
MIIDVHAHWGPWFFTMDVAGVSLAAMDRYGIDLAVVSATEAVIYDAPAGNRALAGVLETQDRLFGYVTVNPRRLADAERDLREFLPTGRFAGVKIHTDYTGSPVVSAQTREALELTASFGCPALVHTWGTSVLDLAEVCAGIPGLRVIAGHMGADGFPHAIEAARSCDRLYLEPCWSHAPAGRFARVAAEVDDRRLLFGTDSTLIDPSSAFGSVAAAGLTGATAERVAWRNAAELFGLPGLSEGRERDSGR